MSGRIVQADQIVGKARADGLHRAGVLRVLARQGHAAGHDDAGQVVATGQGHHGRGQSLVARCDAHDALAQRQRTDQPAHGDGGVVAVGKAVEHADGALRASVARVADIGCEGRDAVGA